MKKIIAGIVLALMVIALPVGLVGCKKGIEGTYKFNKAEYTWSEGFPEGIKTQIQNGVKEFEGVTTTINKDKTWVAKDKDGEIVDEGTWEKVSGDVYKIKSNDDDEASLPFDEMTIKNGVAKATVSGTNGDYTYTVVMTFKR